MPIPQMPVMRGNIGPNRSTKNGPLMADLDAALMEQILDIAKRQWEPNVQHPARRIISGLV